MPPSSLTWSGDHRGAVTALATFTVSYLIYWFAANSPALKRFCERCCRAEKAQALRIVCQRFAGVVFLGIPAFAVTIALPEFRLRAFGVAPIDSLATLY